ncbi:MAG: ornithine carbamoyltransferase [Methylacidiphilales bacterium]|nr:ornithine carbamoyltransferase [Candidatus Methylacidiphilales bacterium]MDW8350006.1 ornithine carbamoyltransferase [Verrucomicrobiae bacterium]
MRHLLSIRDLRREDVREIFAFSREFKAARGSAHLPHPLSGEIWALVFSKPSTRTRVSFEVAIRELGGQSLFLSAQEIQLGRGEPIEDTARVLGRMIFGTVIRTYDHRDVEIFSKYSNRPTINALTDQEHPCQILADIFTFEEKRGSIQGRRVAFIGDAACNVAISWAHAAALLDFELCFAAPQGYACPIQNPHVRNTTDPYEAAAGADLLYTDVWVSMGMEAETEKRLRDFQGYQINHDLLRVAAPQALVQHCLPAYRGKEISAELLDEKALDIFDEAENRLHVQKGILAWIKQSC